MLTDSDEHESIYPDGRISGSDQPQFFRFERGLRARLHAQFGQDIGHVVFDGSLGNHQLIRDFPIAQTVDHQSQYVAFAGRERVPCRSLVKPVPNPTAARIR